MKLKFQKNIALRHCQKQILVQPANSGLISLSDLPDVQTVRKQGTKRKLNFLTSEDTPKRTANYRFNCVNQLKKNDYLF